MAENLDILNTAVSLLIKAALLAARFAGRVRQRYLKRLPTGMSMPKPGKSSSSKTASTNSKCSSRSFKNTIIRRAKSHDMRFVRGS